jgi:sulfur-oxidizing protein SoxY
MSRTGFAAAAAASRPIGRRAFGAGVLALALVRVPAAAAQEALPPDVAAAVRAAIGDAVPEDGGIALTLPASAENGAQVPLTVEAEDDGSPGGRVTAIHLFATRNPTPGIASFRFGDAVRPAVQTRIRLAEGQRVLAYAVRSDGTVRRVAAEARVSVGGCLT